MSRTVTVMGIMFLTATLAVAQIRTDAGHRPTVIAGDGIVRENPDFARLTVGAEARPREPERAQQQSADAMAAVMARLKALGMPPDAISTERYELRPGFDYVNGKRTHRGYLAVNTVEVRIDDLGRIGAASEDQVRTPTYQGRSKFGPLSPCRRACDEVRSARGCHAVRN